LVLSLAYIILIEEEEIPLL